MTKRIMFGGLLLLLASCGGDSKDVDKENGDGGSKTHPVTGSGGSSGSSSTSSSSGGSSGSSSSSSSGDGGPGSSAAGNDSSSGDSGSGGSSSTPGGGTAPTDGSQLAQCTRSSDCDDGLNCYTFGRYCSAACATDADCASLGSAYTCNARTTTGGGGFPGGGMMGADAAAPMPTGTCRLECTGTSDTSCPSGMTCVSAGGFTGGGGFPGGMGGDAGTATMGTFRCQYPMEAPTQRDGGTPGGTGGTMGMMGSGDTPAFGQCSNDSDCSDGLNCTAGRTSSGYCTETCMMAADCTMMPGSGTATPTCGAGGNCTLSCAAMGSTCPTGMTCVRAGGGGPGGGTGTATCNFARTGTMMPGGGFQGGG